MGGLLSSRRLELTILAGAAAFFAFAPALPPLSLCVVHAMSGVPCPTCGTTRALFALFHGEVLAAWSLNPIAFIVVIVAMRRAAALTLADSALMRRVTSAMADRVLLMLFFVTGLTQFVCRNV